MRFSTALVLAATSAVALAACDGGGGTDAAGGSGSTLGSSDGVPLCVDVINQYRASLGLPAYTRWTTEEACADTESDEDSVSGKAHGAFGTCKESAQDECPGWPGPPAEMIPKCLQAMWSEGPGADFSKHGHYINMSSTSYTQVACGFSTAPDGTVWAVQDFK